MKADHSAGVFRGLILALIAALGLPSPAWGGWTPDGVTVTPTTASIPLVAACSDGASGTFVAWHEVSGPGQGVLRVQHLLVTGDLDPAWPAAGAVAANANLSIASLQAHPDRLGGVYLVWTVGSYLAMTRMDADGQTAGGWPAGGRLLATVDPAPRPCVIEDAGSGLYVGWVEPVSGPGHRAFVAWVHLGSGNVDLGYGGAISTEGFRPELALAPDGGVFMGWAAWTPTAEAPDHCNWRLLRLSSAGIPDSGWSPEGLEFGSFDRSVLDGLLDDVAASFLALSPDGRGGVFLMLANPTSSDGFYVFTETRLYRRQGDGSSAPDWPDGGRPVSDPLVGGVLATYPDASIRVFEDGLDGAIVGTEYNFDHGIDIDFERYSASGTHSWGTGGKLVGYEVVRKHDGGIFLGTVSEDGPYNMYDYWAFLRLDQAPYPAGWSNWTEIHEEPVLVWYGDIGLAASLSDDGVVFFWSQVRERIGLFARRFSTYGEVTAVAAGLRALALHALRFVPGVGVRAAVSLAEAGSGRLELFDLLGRRVAWRALAGGAGVREVTLPGTAALRSGIYFARLKAGETVARGRVVVAR